jgi:hypothetical protein
MPSKKKQSTSNKKKGKQKGCPKKPEADARPTVASRRA